MGRIFAAGIAVVLGLFIMVAIGSGLGFFGSALDLKGKKYLENERTDALHQTNQYQTTKVVELSTFQEKYEDLDTQRLAFSRDPKNADIVASIEAQQASIINQMKQDVLLIPGHVPAQTAEFLEGK
jgi:hypothetical protein